MRKPFSCALVVSLLIVVTVAANAPTVKFKFKDFQFPGAEITTVYGVNNAGVLVGQYFKPKGPNHGFKFDHGKALTIDHPNGTDTVCSAINSKGEIVGWYTASSGNNHGFLYKNGKFKEIAPAALSDASGINDNGDIVGSETDCDFCQQHAFLWNGHKFKQIDVPEAQYTGARGLNNKREISIIAPDNNNHFHSYIYRSGHFEEVSVPGASDTFIQGINNVGDVLFGWDDSQQNNHGALRHGGHFYEFDRKKNANTLPFSLNDTQLVVGYYYGIAGSGSFKASY
jgi:probable HAF family extracellular repeat protein